MIFDQFLAFYSSQLKNNHNYNFSHLYDIIISTPCHSNSIRSFISSSQCEMERWQIYLSKSILLGIEFMYIRLTSNVYGENICVYIYLCMFVSVWLVTSWFVIKSLLRKQDIYYVGGDIIWCSPFPSNTRYLKLTSIKLDSFNTIVV